jgi:hypothetical protein
MIVETIIAGLTTIFVSSLIFVNAQIKRQRKWELEDNAPEPEPEPLPTIDPFIEVHIDTPCPKCRTKAKNQVNKKVSGYIYVESQAEGPALPTACCDDKCKAKKLPHLHANCYSCHYHWFMAPADSKKKTTETAATDLPKEERKEQ